MLVDDVDGGDAAVTVTFAPDGVTYEIDLSDTNAQKLRDDLATWSGHARRTGRTGTRKRGNSNGGGVKRSDLSAVREWARQNGHTVSERGRISSEIQQAYDNAH
jgi:hypothetical protein